MQRINLLPQQERTKESRERGLIWAIVALVVVVAVLGLVYWKYNNDVNARQSELDRITADTALERDKIEKLRPYAELQNQRTAMTEAAKGIYQTSVPFSAILQQLSLVIPDNVRLQSFTAVVPPTMLPGAAVAAPAEGAAAATTDITFAGQTEEHRDVAEFMTRLGLIPQIKGILLTSSTDSAPTAGATTGSAPPAATYTQFTVTAQLRPYLQMPPATTLQTEVAQ